MNRLGRPLHHQQRLKQPLKEMQLWMRSSLQPFDPEFQFLRSRVKLFALGAALKLEQKAPRRVDPCEAFKTTNVGISPLETVASGATCSINHDYRKISPTSLRLDL